MTLLIRWATKSDVTDAIHVLCEVADERARRSQFRWDKASFTPEALGAWIDAGELVVAELDGRVIGTMLVQPIDHVFWPDRPDGEALHVHKLARLPEAAAAKGLARALIAFAEEETRRRGLPWLRLDCAPAATLCALYEGLGFTRLDVVEIRPDFVSVRWEKAVHGRVLGAFNQTDANRVRAATFETSLQKETQVKGPPETLKLSADR